MKHLTSFSLALTVGAALLAACTQAPQAAAPAGTTPVMTDNNGILVVSARLSGVARRVQAAAPAEPTLLSDIQTLRVELLDANRETVTSQSYPNPGMLTPLAFRNLRANTKYFIRAEVYLDAVASVTPGEDVVASAETAATVTPDELNPTVANLTLQLPSQPFQSEAENVVQILDGTWVYDDLEEIATTTLPAL